MFELEIVPQIRAVLLLFIAISANFLGSTLNCSLQKTLTDNPVIKHLFLYLIIVFTIDFTSKSDLSIEQVIFKSFIIYLFYILLTKQSMEYLTIIIILLITLYLVFIQMNYEKSKSKDISNYINILNYLTYGIGIVTVVGFGLYLNKQQQDHPDDFDITKFIFGNSKCAGLS